MESSTSPCAFVSCLWGTKDEHFLNALVLGFSLNEHNKHMDKILLVTADVWSNAMSSLLKFFWKIRCIRDFHVPAVLVQGANPRFARVFNKLWAWQLTEYSKVCLLDTDILVSRNVEELFRLPTPTALIRGQELPKPGDMPSWYQGINAGVIILSPSLAVLSAMTSYLITTDYVDFGTAPEQNFLSGFFTWKESLDWKYNFQLQQLMFSSKDKVGDGTDVVEDRSGKVFKHSKEFGKQSRVDVELSEVAVFHFSTEWKPSTFLCSKDYALHGFDDLDRFLYGFFSKFSCRHHTIQSKIKSAFERWFEYLNNAWKSLLEKIFNITCPLCGFKHTSILQQNVCHAMFRCPSFKRAEYLRTWREELKCHLANPQDLISFRHCVPSLHFIACVHRLRFLTHHGFSDFISRISKRRDDERCFAENRASALMIKTPVPQEVAGSGRKRTFSQFVAGEASKGVNRTLLRPKLLAGSTTDVSRPKPSTSAASVASSAATRMTTSTSSVDCKKNTVSFFPRPSSAAIATAKTENTAEAWNDVEQSLLRPKCPPKPSATKQSFPAASTAARFSQPRPSSAADAASKTASIHSDTRVNNSSNEW